MAKVHQIQFRLGLSPKPRWGAYDAPPEPLVGWRGGHPLPRRLPLNAYGTSLDC